MDSPPFDSSKYAAAENSGQQENADLSQSIWDRERNIVGGGLKDGLSKIVSTTSSDLSNGFKSFSHDPLTSSKSYLSDHWQEGAAGAAIAMLAPRGWVNKLLIAYALRSPVAATLHAGSTAAFTNDNANQARRMYGNTMAHEGSALLAALPMTMAGGIAGKATADAIFGKNLGLSDTFLKSKDASGETVGPQLGLTDIKSNFRDLRYRVIPPQVRRAFTDMDNTLLDFSTFEAIGIKEGIGQVAANLKKAGHEIPEENLYKMIGAQMDAARSHDYPWSLELALAKPLKVGEPGGMSVAEFNNLAIKPFWKALDDSRRDNISLLPGVEPSLAKLDKDGIETVIVSDARADSAIQRAQSAKLKDGSSLLDNVDRVYALAGKEAPPLRSKEHPDGLPAELLEHGQARMDASMAAIEALPEGKFTIVPSTWEKPAANSFELDLARHPGTNGKQLDPRQTIMIGDSRTKDVAVAGNAGMVATWRRDRPNNALWAEFGDPKKGTFSEQVMTRLRPGFQGGSDSAVPKLYPSQLEQATTYADLLKYIKPRADYRYLANSIGKSALDAIPIKSSLGASLKAMPGTSTLAYSWQPRLSDAGTLAQRQENSP